MFFFLGEASFFFSVQCKYVQSFLLRLNERKMHEKFLYLFRRDETDFIL